MTADSPAFELLIDQIYEAAVYPEKWASTLHDLSLATASAGAVILLRRSDNWIGWRCSQALQGGAKAYLESDAPQRSRTTERLLAANRAGFVPGSEVFTEEEYKADAMVAEWAVPNGFYYGAATAIHTPSGDLTVVQVQRAIGVPTYDSADLALLDSFRPHLARASLLAARLQFERFHAIARGLELVGLPALLLDRSGRLLCANGSAEALRGHIGWGASNRVHLKDGAADMRLQSALRDTQRAGILPSCSFPSRSTESGAAVVHLIPVAGTARDLFEGGFTLMLITPIGVRPAQDAALLQALFDLTPAETEICRYLGKGYGPTRIASERSTAVDTIRSQLKSIFAKTGTSGQAELVALLATVPAIGI